MVEPMVAVPTPPAASRDQFDVGRRTNGDQARRVVWQRRPFLVGFHPDLLVHAGSPMMPLEVRIPLRAERRLDLPADCGSQAGAFAAVEIEPVRSPRAHDDRALGAAGAAGTAVARDR